MTVLDDVASRRPIGRMTAALCGHTHSMATTDGVMTELRDDQQLRVVRRLHAAGGGPLDFEELRAMGIEHPAVVCYELEIAGVPIVQTRSSDRRMLVLELPTDELEPDAGRHGGEHLPAVASVRRRVAIGTHRLRVLRTHALGALRRQSVSVLTTHPLRRLGVGLAHRGRVRAESVGADTPAARRALALLEALRAGRARLAAGLALTVVLVAVVAILLSANDTARTPLRSATSARARERHSGPRATAPSTSRPRSADASAAQLAEPGRVGTAAPAHVSLRQAATLEREGHQLLEEGHYAAATRELAGAVRASGQSLARCTEPTTEACLTFAYALYDLGRALRLNGQAAAAIPVLDRRLRIDNQRTVVQHELELARGGST